MTDPNQREIVVAILDEILEQGKYSHLVLKATLDKYQYLSKQQRAFITVSYTHLIPANNTTPESYVVQEYFRKMLDAGCDYAVMEVSSQGLMMHRVDGFTFDVGIFTNIEPDHIGPNEHASFEDYLQCKAKLFQKCRLGIVNADDVHVAEILKNHTCKVQSYGFSEQADICLLYTSRCV